MSVGRLFHSRGPGTEKLGELMNMQMRLQIPLPAQQYEVPNNWFKSLSTILKSGRPNGIDALLIDCTLWNLILFLF